MNKIGAWIDALPLPPLLVIVLILGGAPFVPEPHLVGKIRMLANGTLVRPIDIFDLLYHSAPFVVLLYKLVRLKTATRIGQE
ncbi:MAG: RND transporter [Candidatus Electrothrix scaldis]|nr:MAG: RND transporter [Candidatus Electrothrix sp. GW3-3]